MRTHHDLVGYTGAQMNSRLKCTPDTHSDEINLVLTCRQKNGFSRMTELNYEFRPVIRAVLESFLDHTARVLGQHVGVDIDCRILRNHMKKCDGCSIRGGNIPNVRQNPCALTGKIR